jgi:hypothetical protein
MIKTAIAFYAIKQPAIRLQGGSVTAFGRVNTAKPSIMGPNRTAYINS